eukprot:scaffold574191_cov19-Prasinocladus_malaysianus.AAC.1
MNYMHAMTDWGVCWCPRIFHLPGPANSDGPTASNCLAACSRRGRCLPGGAGVAAISGRHRCQAVFEGSTPLLITALGNLPPQMQTVSIDGFV